MTTAHRQRSSRRPPRVAFVWDNFGPMHDDRCIAIVESLGGEGSLVGIELVGRSDTYDWITETAPPFEKITLFPGESVERIGIWRRFIKTVRACRRTGATHVFLCHYEHPATLLTAIALRFLGRRVIVMNDSKYDDYERSLIREVGKTVFYMPYQGGLASGYRSRDYLRFLGVSAAHVKGVYNALSIKRVQALAGVDPAPGGVAFADRHFTIVARFVPKKNLSVAIDAYRQYRERVRNPRPLHICGSGALESQLRSQVEQAGLSGHVNFLGFLQADGVCRQLGSTLALLLPSIEEQFGNVVLEAQAMGAPVILSTNCGARDEMVRTGVNGFVVEPDNAEGMALFMAMLSEDEELWRRMSSASERFRPYGDCRRFSIAVEDLIAELP